ncbi:MAG: hypothetical protein HUJ77_04085 [Clostridium sp.]|uniref:hypothetical protein n=1 Tax=Clostridium sp. TaxID=1506 RepID=UPI0025BD5674|nr:hypothetical protein [Clostridium sp.]MCF0147559.1 hypothetical protein [Clostridium sp.]
MTQLDKKHVLKTIINLAKLYKNNLVNPDTFIRELTGKELSTELSQYKKRFNHSSNESYKREIKELMRNSISENN